MILLYYIIVYDFKYLQGDVTVRAKSLFLLYYTVYRKKFNDFKDLHCGVNVYCKSLFYIVYTVYGASPEDEEIGLTF